jgi:ubiquinone/menaquinone biosynthesis C-methylase UbiE
METSSQGQEVKQQTREIFESWAEHYATERGQLPTFRSQVDIVLKMLAGESGRVLDIGCAAGSEIVDLRRLGFSVLGIDLAPTMLQFAHRRFENDGQVHFCQADIDQLPFPPDSMDHVVCLGVFEFLPDYGRALREIRRVLRPGGTAVFAIPTSISLYATADRLANRTLVPLWRIARRLMGRRTTPGGKAFHRNLCNPRRFHAMLREYGLEPRQFRYSNYFIYPFDRIPKLNEKVAQMLEPLASVPFVRYGASVHLVSVRLPKPLR